jgi:DNA-binding transcriptional ArsR family regulator
MKSQDIFVLLKLVCLEKETQRRFRWDHDPYSVRAIADAIGLSKSEVSYSIMRSTDSGLVYKSFEHSTLRVHTKALFEFLVYGLKYVFPTKPGSSARGVATSFAAPVLKGKVMSGGASKLVWPYAEGHDAGYSIEPLYKSVPIVAERDDELYAYLALADAIRVGNPRETEVAIRELEARLWKRG